MIGIYAITNQQNNYFYIGSARNIFSRWSEHIKCLENNTHANNKLQNAWKKYKEDNFQFSILEECTEDKLLEREQHYIDILKPEYNICLIAGSRLGTKHSEETKKKWSEKRKGIIPWNKGKKTGPLPPEWKEKVIKAGRKSIIRFNKSCKGKHLSEEHKRKVSQALKGRVFTKEHRQRLSEATKRYILKSSGSCPI